MLDTHKTGYRIGRGVYIRIHLDTRRVKFIYTTDDRDFDTSEMVFSFDLLSEVGEPWQRMYEMWMNTYGLTLEIEDTSEYYGNVVKGKLP